MATIKCNNTRNEGGAISKCDRFFMQVSDVLLDALRENPGAKIITRCPTCPGYQRWIAIYYDAENGMVWEALENKPESFDPEMNFNTIINSQQVG